MSVRDKELIVVGASAGGVQAYQNLLSALPRDWSVPLLCVLHIPQQRISGLIGLLSHCCALPVQEAEDKQPIQPGTVTFAPPDYHLLVEERGYLALSRDEPVLFSRPSIDVLFESAALAYGKSVHGILLTGASADGSDGLARIRGEGGSAWVQDPLDAVAPTMPASAIAQGGADAVLTMAEICRRLATHAQ